MRRSFGTPKGSRRAALLAALALSCSGSPLRVEPGPSTAPSTAPPAAREAAASEPHLDEPHLDEPHLDDPEAPEPPEHAAVERAHPLDGVGEQALRELLRNDLGSVGSISLGQPSAGALMNGVPAQASPLFTVQSPEGAYGTAETLEYLSAAIRAVHAAFPDTPPLALGHISAREGGPLSPHISHQSGRDVDLSFYYSDGSGWYARATRKNLDLPRTWALVRALVTETDVEMILVDHSIQTLLERHALEAGEDPEWVRGLFRGGPGGLRRIIRHAPGHATHLHIRFYNPVAQETGRRVLPVLAELGLRKAPPTFLRHRARSGDTLGKLAKKYGTSVAAIKTANGLRNSRIRENREYKIPVAGRKPIVSGPPLRFPPRRLPPRRPTAPPSAPRVSAR